MAAQVAAAEAAVAAFVKRAAATPVPDPSIDEGGDPSAIAAQRHDIGAGWPSAIAASSSTARPSTDGPLGSDSVKAFAEFCGAAFKATLALEAELQGAAAAATTTTTTTTTTTIRRHHHCHPKAHLQLCAGLQRLAAPIADDEKPPPSTPGGGAVVVEGGNLSAGGVAVRPRRRAAR